MMYEAPIFAAASAPIASIRISRLWENCERTTFHVTLMNDEGFDMTVASWATGSVYTDHVGLSIEDARERALIDADRWGDFLRIVPEPYLEDGIEMHPSMTMRFCETRRILARRKAERAKADVSGDAQS